MSENETQLTAIVGELIEVGVSYFSRCGNKAKILEYKEVVVSGKIVYQYKGQIIAVIPGHEILLYKMHWYDAKGKWLKNPGGIHDIVRKANS
jgi:hypothetical protein